MISAKDVKKLRDMTGAGMMDAKRALLDADGDVDKAIVLLRERGLASIGKRANLKEAELAAFDRRDKTPARPPRLR